MGPGQAHERQVADQVQDFMAHRFIAKSQGWIEPLIAITDQGIVQTAPLDQASCAQLFHLGTQAKGAGWGNLLHETFGGEHKGKQLAPNGPVCKFNRGPHPQAIGWQDRGKTGSLLKGEGRLQGEG
jgi:hypothetical protein